MAFHYTIGPKNGGGLTTHPAIQGTKSTAELVQLIMQRSGQSEAATTAVLRAFCESMIDLARDTYRVEPLFGLLAMTPTSGGSEDTDAFTGTLDNINAGISLFLGKEGNLRFAHDFTSVRDGEHGYKTAVVARVTNKATGSGDCYTPLKGLLLEGTDLRIDTSNAEAGVFLHALTGGAVVRIPNGDYLVNDPSKLLVLMPAGLTGQQNLIVKTVVGHSVRVFNYGYPLNFETP